MDMQFLWRFCNLVLIETLWNVNKENDEFTRHINNVLIETLWNVNLLLIILAC